MSSCCDKKVNNICSACSIVNGLYKLEDVQANKHSCITPVEEARTHCLGDKIINIVPNGHLMLSNTITFPNNVAKILKFGIQYQRRHFSMGIDQVSFYPKKSDTFPLYCVTNGGKKYCTFGSDFLSIDMRTFLCSIANYNKAMDTNTCDVKKFNDIVNCYKKISSEKITRSYINTHCKNIRWVAGLYDLTNIDDVTLDQVISKKCILSRMINNLKQNLNLEYTFDTELVLSTALSYANEGYDNIHYVDAFKIFADNLDKYKKTHYKKLKHVCVPVDIEAYIKNIRDVNNEVTKVLCPELVEQITFNAFDKNLSNHISNICDLALIHCTVVLDFTDKSILNAMRLIMYHCDNQLLKSFNHCVSHLPIEQKPIVLKEHVEVLETYDEDLFLTNIKSELKQLIISNKKIIEYIELKPNHKHINNNSKYFLLLKLIKSNALCLDDIISYKRMISVLIREQNNMKSQSDKRFAVKYLHDKVINKIREKLNDPLHSRDLNVPFRSTVINTIINGNYTEPICLWLYKNFKDTFSDHVILIAKELSNISRQKKLRQLENRLQHCIIENNFYDEQLQDANTDVHISIKNNNNNAISAINMEIAEINNEFKISDFNSLMKIINKNMGKKFINSMSIVIFPTIPKNILDVCTLSTDTHNLNKIMNRLEYEDSWHRPYCSWWGYQTLQQRIDKKQTQITEDLYNSVYNNTQDLITDIQKITHHTIC